MRKISLIPAALLALSVPALAADYGTNPVAMTYFKMNLDGTASQQKPSYGFGVSRLSEDPSAGATSLLDAPRWTDMQFQEGKLQSLKVNNFTFAYRDPATDQLNAFGDRDDPATWVVGGL